VAHNSVKQHTELYTSLFGFDMIYLAAVGFTPGGNSAVHIYKQTVHRTTQ